MNQITQKTGIIYCRVSSQDQVQNTSLESQERCCREYAERQGIVIIEPPFIERGESAKSANRTEFQKAIARCADRKHPVNFFIVYKLDRFARNQDDHVTVRAMLKRYGTELRSATEPINESPVGRAMEGMISVFSELDNNIRTERTRGGMLARAQQGIWCWRAPLGYYRIGARDNILPHPETAPYIKLIFEEWAKGTYSYESLATFMADRGMRTSTGKRPGPQLMEKIIKNEIYCGIISCAAGEFEGSFDPIVSKELFQKCQRGQQSVKRSFCNPLFPLKGMTLCSDCLKPLTGSSSKGKMGIKYPYYHHYRKGCRLSVSIPKSTLEQLFVEYLENIAPNARFEKLFRSVVLDNWKNNYKKLDENNARIRKQLEKLEAQRQAVFDLHRGGKYTDDEFLEQKQLVNDRINQKYQLIEENRIEEFDMDEALNTCFAYARSPGLKWKEANYPMRLRLQSLIIKGKTHFNGKKFGTQDLSVIYKLVEESSGKKSHLVAPPGFEPGFDG